MVKNSCFAIIHNVTNKVYETAITKTAIKLIMTDYPPDKFRIIPCSPGAMRAFKRGGDTQVLYNPTIDAVGLCL